MQENLFNLIDEAWIPVTQKGLVSLKQIFNDNEITALGGNPIEKIAVLKLLLAIAQSAYTPKDEEDWRQLGPKGMCNKVLDYLNEHYDAFWLYGEKPFLQMPEIEKAEKKNYGTVLPMVATGNTTVLTQINVEKPLNDPEKALLLLQLMGFPLGGKKTDNSVVLTPGYYGKANEKGNPSTGKPGPCIGFLGFLHSFIFEYTLINTIWINLFSHYIINEIGIYPEGLGIAPWEKMPKGEDDEVAKHLKKSYMGRLIPLSRFLLLKEDGIHYSEGISSPGYKEGIFDPSIAVDFSSNVPRALWVSTDKKPWRQLPSLLSFMGNSSNNFKCIQLEKIIPRIKNFDSFIVWSGGAQISNNAGEQFFSGNDDFVESEIQLSCSLFNNESQFYTNLNIELNYMEYLSSILKYQVKSFFKKLHVQAEELSSQSVALYWQICERNFLDLVNACSDDPTGEKARALRIIFEENAYKAFDHYCPNQTARQLEAWASTRPRFWANMKNKKKEAEVQNG